MQSCDGIPNVWVGVVTVIVLIVDLSKGQGHFLPIEARSGPGLKLLLICPRQPVDQGFGSLSGVRGDISDYIAQSAAQGEPTHCPAICLHKLF